MSNYNYKSCICEPIAGAHHPWYSRLAGDKANGHTAANNNNPLQNLSKNSPTVSQSIQSLLTSHPSNRLQ